MAIELITGLPGNSKTLYSIRTIIDRAVAENRVVYYAGLKQFKNDDERLKGSQWIEFDPLTWHETVPSGSIIFIDEAQKLFRSRSLGAVPPKHVTELEEHRHKGLDFYMVTQHPSLIDAAVRKLTQTHKHLVRIWGMEATTVHRWDAVRDNCDKPPARKDSEKQKWAFDKSLYGVYHSADVHTMKRRIPGRVKLLLCLPLLLGGFGYLAYSRMSKLHAPPPVENAVAPAPGVPAHVAGVGPVGGPAAPVVPLAVTDPLFDAKIYVATRTPRVEGLPQTAPRYDALTVPVRVPVPAMCVQVGSVHDASADVKCKCFTQQGTPMDVKFNMCVEFARNGFFQDFDAEADKRAVARTEESARVIEASPAGRSQAPSQVVVFDKVPDEPLRVVRTSKG